MNWLAEWWVWLIAAILLGILEMLAPAYIFLGFALGAAVTGVVLLIGGPLAVWLTGSLPVLFLFFALASLISWFVLRRALGVRKGQVKVFDHDINED